jgi:hypothetical protein
MSFIKRYIESQLSPNPDSDSNITCNILVVRNQTLVVIQRGWEGIPESIVINLSICAVFILILILISFYINLLIINSLIK